MAIDWKTIISEFDGKPTLLQAIGKLRKAVEDETITIQQAQAEIAKLKSQQKADEALITTARATANDALDLATTNKAIIIDKVDKITGAGQYIRIYGVSKYGIQTVYEASETDVPWKIVRRDASGSFDIPAATKSTQPIRKATFDFELSQKQKLLSGEKKFLFNGKEVFAPDYTGGTMVVSKGLKTLFGNQSLVGMGNIDLYRHQLTFTTGNDVNASKKGYAVIYSSKNTQIKSLADLKTILGNTFLLPVYGQYVTLDGGDNEHFYDFCFVTESKIYVRSYYNINGVSPDEQERIITDVANVTWSHITITDTVTTI